jgi:nucleotide-binding universal stress UspA family protein
MRHTAARISSPASQLGPIAPPAVRRATEVERRLAYTPAQAARALGVGRSTLYRLLPYVDTVELPWGGTLIPVDELERLLAERRRPPRRRRRPNATGRPPTLPTDVVERIRVGRAEGKSLRQIAAELNADGTPTAHDGMRWWPSTVRSVLIRAASL